MFAIVKVLLYCTSLCAKSAAGAIWPRSYLQSLKSFGVTCNSHSCASHGGSPRHVMHANKRRYTYAERSGDSWFGVERRTDFVL